MCSSLLQKTCLKSTYSLRTQLLLSFGISAFVTLALVFVMACTAAHIAGTTVKDNADDLMRRQVTESLLTASRLVGEQIDAYMVDLEGTVQLIVESVKDRIVGYPYPGWEDDRYVPFVDIDTMTRKYPLKHPPPPMDWNITSNVNLDNAEEHVQERAPYFEAFQPFTTRTAAYFMQGACDPSVVSISLWSTVKQNNTYYPNCTVENNNYETGGVVQPTPTNRGLYMKSGDFTPVLKSLYEAQGDSLVVGVYFHNSGAGSQVVFPGFVWPGGKGPYVSEGCDWMREINEYTGRPYATEDEIARCHPNGTLVPQREFNAMEKPWCRYFAQHPEKVNWYGPYQAFGGAGVGLMTVGRGIFDRRSGEFIGCAALDVQVNDLSKHLDASVINKHSELMLYSFTDGQLVSSSTNASVFDRNESLRELDVYLVESIKGRVNFTDPWTPEEAEEKFQNISECPIRGLVTAYPIPVIPDEYSPNYDPRFFVLHTISNDVFEVVESINSSIKGDVRRICGLAGGLAIAGMIIVLSIVWCVSRMLTKPLLWIESAAWRIVNHADDSKYVDGEALSITKGDDHFSSNSVRCTPETEVNQLVEEFRTMICCFSGTGASKVAESALHEVRNDLTWHSDFQQLYSVRPKYQQAERSYRSTSVGSDTTEEGSAEASATALLGIRQQGILHRALKNSKSKKTSVDEVVAAPIVPAPVKRNRSHVICTPSNNKQLKDSSIESTRIFRSALFWWIVVLIVIPLLLLICITCTVVSNNIVTQMPEWVQTADKASDDLAINALNLTAKSKASLMNAVVFEAVRDLHFITRVAGWLFFGGIERSSSFTQMDNGSNVCKPKSSGTCPVGNSTSDLCPCQWMEMNPDTCPVVNFTEVREMQKIFWGAHAQDADPTTGRRNNSASFPAVGSTPESVPWYRSPSELPGSDKGAQAAGYATSYDRLRVASALAVAVFPVNNYQIDFGWKNNIHLGSYIGFEEDGMILGVAKCKYYVDYVNFVSNEENRGAVVAPSICPNGKYGYDARCRDWYDSGKRHYLNSTNPEPIHFTAAYKLAIVSEESASTSATAPVANPRTSEYVGQGLIIFQPDVVSHGLSKLGGSAYTPIMITPSVGVSGADTVIEPPSRSASSSIVDLLFEYDDPGSPHRTFFVEKCRTPMRNGSFGLVTFNRTTQNGDVEELMISFAPVYERALLPVSPDDFSRGSELKSVLLYSLGMIKRLDDVHAPFEDIKDTIKDQLDKIQTMYIIVTIAVAALFTSFTCIVTIYIVRPMIILLEAVQNINKRVVDGDLPPMKGGSREVHGVYNTFAKLFKVVRISNTAFFSGNLKWAYHFVSDALQLFRKVNDSKAVGIACNNLGNTLFAVYYDGVEDIGLDDYGEKSLIPIALSHYGEAIALGEKQFDETPESELKAEFALQLADRLFNRGLFLLLIDGDELAPKNARVQAFADIRRARNLDYDVKDYMLEHKLLLKNSGKYYSRLLRRINGLADFHDDIGIHEVWDVRELINDADQLLFAAWNEVSAPLFEEVNRVGRLQQLEAAAISLWISKGNLMEAARLAMRMFAEDEHLLESALVRAADALLHSLRGEIEGMSFTNETINCTRDDLRRMVKCCKNVTLDIGKCLVFTCELCERWEGDPMLEKLNENSLALYDRHCSPNDYMGVVAYSTEESLTVELGTKEENEGRQRSLLDIATSSTTERANPAFPLAIQMVVDAQASMENDSYIILMIDGYAWDSEACSSLKLQIERLNRERNTMIHLFIIGMDMEDENAREQCIQLSTVSKLSMYADATLETIDSIFDTIMTAMAGRPVNNGFLKGITMERF